MKKNFCRAMLLILISGMILSCSGIGVPGSEASNPTVPVVVIEPLPSVQSSDVPVEATTLPETPGVDMPSSGSEPATSGFYSGILVGNNQNEIANIYDLNGTQLGEVQLPGLYFPSPEYLYAYGMQNQDVSTLSVIYYVNNGPVLRKSYNGQIVDLSAIQPLVNLRGFPSQPKIVLGTGRLQGSGLTSELLVADFVNEPIFTPLISEFSANSHVYSPLATISDHGLTKGIWFTMEAWGTTGTYFFPRRYGLYYLDVASGNTHWLYNDDYRPSSLSVDGQLAAMSSIGPSNAGGLKIYELETLSPIVSFPLMMGQDLGAGYALISPDNSRVAWTEAGGEFMAMQSTFHCMLRYADLSAETPIHSIPATEVAQSSLPYPNAIVKPVAWLSNEYLLIESSTIQEKITTLYLVNTTLDEINKLAEGSFMGLIQ